MTGQDVNRKFWVALFPSNADGTFDPNSDPLSIFPTAGQAMAHAEGIVKANGCKAVVYECAPLAILEKPR